MITVKKMESHEKQEVVLFVNRAMREEYGCDAHALPATVFIARDSVVPGGEALVGAIGMSMGRDGPLPVEQLFLVDHDAFNRGLFGCAGSAQDMFFHRGEMAQFGRWVASVPGVAAMLIRAAVGHAREHDCAWGIGEAKPAVARHFDRMGIRTVRVPGRAILRNVPPNVLPYYTTAPLPGVYLFPLIQPYFSAFP